MGTCVESVALYFIVVEGAQANDTQETRQRDARRSIEYMAREIGIKGIDCNLLGDT